MLWSDVDHLEVARETQVAIFRAMSPGERWKAAHRLYWSARRLKAAYLKSRHPDWTDEQVEEAVREAFMHARS